MAFRMRITKVFGDLVRIMLSKHINAENDDDFGDECGDEEDDDDDDDDDDDGTGCFNIQSAQCH